MSRKDWTLGEVSREEESVCLGCSKSEGDFSGDDFFFVRFEKEIWKCRDVYWAGSGRWILIQRALIASAGYEWWVTLWLFYFAACSLFSFVILLNYIGLSQNCNF